MEMYNNPIPQLLIVASDHTPNFSRWSETLLGSARMETGQVLIQFVKMVSRYFYLYIKIYGLTLLLYFCVYVFVTESCPDLRPLIHGYITRSYSYANYTCFKSFSLVGDTTRKCKNRKWTGLDPICRDGK